MELSEQSGIGTSFNGVLPKVTRGMPIRGFLTGQAFEPEVVRQMSLALETICGKFGMKLADDPATRVRPGAAAVGSSFQP
jgi:hypothetical protein